MVIIFHTEDIQKLCNDDKIAVKRLGKPCAQKLRRRLDDLDAAASLADFRLLPGRCHELKGNLAGCLALDLHAGFRLVFRPNHDPIPRKSDGGLDWSGVTTVCILAAEDYHD